MISVGYEPNALGLAMEMRQRARSADGLSVPIPDTPVREVEIPNQNSNVSNGSGDGGLEIIGQEMVIHRTLHKAPAPKHPALPVTPTATASSMVAHPAPGLVTPKRPTTRFALPNQEEQGGNGSVGGREM